MEIRREHCALGLELAADLRPAQLSGLANPCLKLVPEAGERSWRLDGGGPAAPVGWP
jgi:hypothetical protein